MNVESVAIQGEAGSFSHGAARQLLGEGVRLLHRASFDSLFLAVTSGEADRGLLPIENSLAGSGRITMAGDKAYDDQAFIDAHRMFDKRVIVSTGMMNAIDVIKLRRHGTLLHALLHCVSAYPCPHDAVNLRAIGTLAAMVAVARWTLVGIDAVWAQRSGLPSRFDSAAHR